MAWYLRAPVGLVSLTVNTTRLRSRRVLKALARLTLPLLTLEV